MDKVKLSAIVHYNDEGIVPLESNVEHALQIMSSDEISSVVVVDENKKPIGIFTEYDALKMVAENITLDTKIKTVMTANVLTISHNKYLHDAYVFLVDSGHRHLIVVDDEQKYIGIVSEGDFLRYISLDHLSKIEIVEETMEKTPLVVERSKTVQEVARQMSSQHFDYAIITKDSEPLGIVDERTITSYVVNHQEKHNIPIQELISEKVYFIDKNAYLQEAAKTLTQHGVRQLIVVNEDKSIVGLLRRYDVLKAINGSYFEFLVETIEKKSAILEQLMNQRKLLSEKTDILDSVINSIPDLVWVKDIEGKYITCNKSFERFFNARREEIIGKNDFDFISKEMAEFFRENDKKAIEADEPRHNEEYLVFGDGSYEGLFDTIKTPIEDSGRKVFGVLGIARDITERKQREEKLQQIDAELQAAEELAHVGSWAWEIEKDQFHGSKESHRVFGIVEKEIISFSEMLEIIHPDDRALMEEKLFHATQTGEFNNLFRIIVEGEEKWISSSAKFIQDESGKYIKAQGMLQDVTVQKLHEMELEKLVNYDTLTGLANRTYLLAHLKKLIQRNKRNQNNAAILLFDLDHFRDINDSFGHNIGDELLIDVSKRISERIRQEDLVCRMSADEFVLVLERLQNKEDVAQVAQEMIDMLSEPFHLSNNIEVRVGVSIGIVLIAENNEFESELLQFADTALFQAKTEGRNCYRFYTDELTASIQERIRYQNEIFHALQNGEFELYYQPQVRIDSNRIIGVEALIRWNHPQKGLINPAIFIPIAEESSLIAQIGAWTLQEACRQGKIWQDQGHELHMSVNVSMNQLQYHDLIKIVDDALIQSAFSADNLVLELTESAMMKREEKLLTILHSLRSKGVSIAIDDFGTGYSSYSYLKKFPVDILKIDKSFIDDIPYKKDADAIVKAIIAMSEILEYQILAEGVEYSEQEEFLRENGCHYYQGYLKSRPLPVKEFEKLLGKKK
jgi:diguanylate cyclase (GGDEF)-like protein/PAS domain S-box-containing protein